MSFLTKNNYLDIHRFFYNNKKLQAFKMLAFLYLIVRQEGSI